MKSAAAAAALTLTLATATTAATLSIPDGNVNFGRVGGIVVPFSSTFTTNWSAPGAPVNGTTYTINSLTVTKFNAAAATGQLAGVRVGVYASYSGTAEAAGTFGDFLGVSDEIVWNTLGAGATATWTFSNVTKTAASGASLVFAFQTSTTSLSTLPSLTLAEGEFALRRMANGNTMDAQGAGIIEASGGSSTAGRVRTDRVPGLQLQITPVPEPSAALLGAFGALALLRRRRA